nr:MAG TPA: hypothetical protein [Caudoviricetes sp.]
MTHPCIRTCMLRINILSKTRPVTVYKCSSWYKEVCCHVIPAC